MSNAVIDKALQGEIGNNFDSQIEQEITQMGIGSLGLVIGGGIVKS